MQGLEHVWYLHHGKGNELTQRNISLTQFVIIMQIDLRLMYFLCCSLDTYLTIQEPSCSVCSCPSGLWPFWSTGRGKWPPWPITGTVWTSMKKRCHSPSFPLLPFSMTLTILCSKSICRYRIKLTRTQVLTLCFIQHLFGLRSVLVQSLQPWPRPWSPTQWPGWKSRTSQRGPDWPACSPDPWSSSWWWGTVYMCF